MSRLVALLVLGIALGGVGPAGAQHQDVDCSTVPTSGLRALTSRCLSSRDGMEYVWNGAAWARASRYIFAAALDFSGIASATAVSTTGQRDPYFYEPSLSTTTAGSDPGRTYHVRITCSSDGTHESLPSAVASYGVAANTQLVVAPPPQAFVPDSTDTRNETVTRRTGINYGAGQAVVVSAAGGGLAANRLYYVGNLSAGTTFSFYDTHAHAISGGATGRIHLTAPITATIDGGGCSAGASHYFVYAGTSAASLTRQNGARAVAIGSSFTLSAYATGGPPLPAANGTGSTTLTVGAGAIRHFYRPVDGVYQVVLLDTQGTPEPAVVEAVGSTTITVTATRTHPAGFLIASATAGIGEATMSFPVPYAPSQIPQGGQVVIPSGMSSLSAPVQTRYGIGYVGAGGNRILGSLSVAYTSQVMLPVRFPGYAVFLCTGSLAGQGCYSNSFRDLSVLGIGSDALRFLAPVDLLTIQNSDIAVSDTRNPRLAAIRYDHGIARAHITETSLRGGFPLHGVGFTNEIYITHSTTYACPAGCEHIWIDASGDGALGGQLLLQDVVHENGDRAIVYARNLSIVKIVGDGAADQAYSPGQNYITIVNDRTHLDQLILRDQHVVGATNAIISLTGGTASYVTQVIVEDCYFPSSPAVPLVKIEGGHVAGPFYSIRNHGVGRPESPKLGISGTFLGGYQYIGNDNGLSPDNGVPDLDARPPTGRMTYAGQKTLTESSATPVVDVGLGANRYAGIDLEYTVHARDSGNPTAMQARRGHVRFAATEQSNGTVSCAVDTSPRETPLTSTGTLTVTWTCVGGPDKVTLKANAVSSLSQTTLEVHYRLRTDGTATRLWQQ